MIWQRLWKCEYGLYDTHIFECIRGLVTQSAIIWDHLVTGSHQPALQHVHILTHEYSVVVTALAPSTSFVHSCDTIEETKPFPHTERQGDKTNSPRYDWKCYKVICLGKEMQAESVKFRRPQLDHTLFRNLAFLSILPTHLEGFVAETYGIVIKSKTHRQT